MHTITPSLTSLHGSVDLLNRLPLPGAPKEVPLPADTIHLLNNLQVSPNSVAQIKKWTACDPILSKVSEMLLSGGIVKDAADLVVSGKATAFTSAELGGFLSANGIRHATSAPYHPASIGLAKRYMQTFKNAIKKSDLQQKLSHFLFHYRSTPHSTTGSSAAQLLGR